MDEKLYTIDDVEKIWKKLDKIALLAEQHDFAELAWIDAKFKPMYKDLHENWDDHHAEVFMRYMALSLLKFDSSVASFIKERDPYYDFFQRRIADGH